MVLRENAGDYNFAVGKRKFPTRFIKLQNMRKTTRLILTGVLGFIGLQSLSAAETAMKVSLADGAESYYILSYKPVVTFSGEMMNVTSPDANASFERGDIRSITFTDYDPSAVGDLKIPPLESLRYVNGEIQAPGRNVEIYTLGGASVASSFENFSTAGLEKGIYIVRAGRQTLKINVNFN